MRDLAIRDYREADALDLAHLYHKAVQRGAAGHYSQAQRDAWCRLPPIGANWSDRLARADTLVAETTDGALGFMTLDRSTGHIDLAYVAPEMRGAGLAATLYAVLEGRARAARLAHLTSEASLLAERFFLRHGWQVVARQVVERSGISIPNARMVKHLTPKKVAAE